MNGWRRDGSGSRPRDASRYTLSALPLTPGTSLGPYQIVAAIGAGGLGEVYRALDTKLNRVVALKILPDAFAADSDRLVRFRREAQVLASLNHPNIAHLYGVEDAGSTHALVMHGRRLRRGLQHAVRRRPGGHGRDHRRHHPCAAHGGGPGL